MTDDLQARLDVAMAEADLTKSELANMRQNAVALIAENRRLQKQLAEAQAQIPEPEDPTEDVPE